MERRLVDHDVRAAVLDTVAMYTHCGDAGDMAGFVGCFAPDGVLELDDGVRLAGRQGIREGMARVVATMNFRYLRHHVSSIRLDQTAPDEVRGASYFLAITERGVDHWGRYRDVFVPHDGVWLIGYRRARRDGGTGVTP